MPGIDFLSTVQVGITLIGTLAGAFGGATLAAELAVYLRQIPSVAPHSESISIAIVVALISYGSLIIGELVPKGIAAGARDYLERCDNPCGYPPAPLKFPTLH